MFPFLRKNISQLTFCYTFSHFKLRDKIMFFSQSRSCDCSILHHTLVVTISFCRMVIGIPNILSLYSNASFSSQAIHSATNSDPIMLLSIIFCCIPYDRCVKQKEYDACGGSSCNKSSSMCCIAEHVFIFIA